MLTSTELRKLVRAHNKLSKIVIPKGSSRDDIIKLIEKAGYKVDHEKKAIKPKVQRGKQITLSQAEELTKPKPKTELQKQKAQEKKAEKEAMKKKQEREIRKKAVEEEKERQKKSALKKKSDNNIKGDREKTQKKNISNNKEMGDTKFIKQQKALQVEKQKETRRALLKAKPPVDKTTRRGKPIVKSLDEQIDNLDKEIMEMTKDFGRIRREESEEKIFEFMEKRKELNTILSKLIATREQMREKKNKEKELLVLRKSNEEQIKEAKKLVEKYKDRITEKQYTAFMRELDKNNDDRLFTYTRVSQRAIEMKYKQINKKGWTSFINLPFKEGKRPEEIVKKEGDERKVKFDGQSLDYDSLMKKLDEMNYVVSNKQKKDIKEDFMDPDLVLQEYKKSTQKGNKLVLTPVFKDEREYGGLDKKQKDIAIRSSFKDVPIYKKILKPKTS